jgi:hypothetical protein
MSANPISGLSTCAVFKGRSFPKEGGIMAVQTDRHHA